MKAIIKTLFRNCVSVWLVFCAIFAFLTTTSHAGLIVDVHLYHDNFGYYFYPYLSGDTNLPNLPEGVYQIASPQIPTNGSRLVYYATNGTISECYNDDCGGGSYYGDFNSMLYGVTNGLWTIGVTNNSSSNTYFFSVSATALTSNTFGALPMAVYPADHQQNIPNQPEIQWTGPANWQGTLYVQDNAVDTNGYGTYVTSDYLAPTATTWTPSVVLPNGTNQFSVTYQSNITALVTAHQPTNHAGQPISAWTSTATMEEHFAYDDQYSVTFVVGSQQVSGFDSSLVARYNFEDTNNPYADSSGNSNNSDDISNGANPDTFSSNAAIGKYARLFRGSTSIAFPQYDPAYTTLSNALSHNFTVTAWINTTATIGTDGANAYYGAPIFFSGNDYNDDCTIPLTITGSKAAFTIVANEGPGTVTLHSTSVVNDGTYHFLAVTRQQSSGLMSLYVDGNLEATGNGITTPVITQGYITIASGGNDYYTGLMDDVRLYSTNLSASDISFLASGGDANGANPLNLASAVGATNLTMTTSGDAAWFVETTNTFNGAPAADQSGSVTGYQTTTLTATVNGPGTLTFNWSSIANDPNGGFDYEFYIDDPDTNDIADLYGTNPWQSIQSTLGSPGPIQIPAGKHTLGWIVYADGDTDPTEAAYLDQVLFTPPDTNPVSANITLSFYREQDEFAGEIYILFPGINSVTPAGDGSTTNMVQSPNGYFSGTVDQGSGESSSAELSSLGQVLNEVTNGLWSLYINYGMPNQRQFQFTVSVTGLTTNVLPAVNPIAPTNGATGIPSTAAIQWLGPTNYSSLNVSRENIYESDYLGASLPVTATSWTPGFDAGTNQFDINYTSNNFPTVAFSTPVDYADSQTVASWTANADLVSTANIRFVVSAGASPVQLLSPQTVGGNLQFSFQSQSGHTNTVYYRTNLVVGLWHVWTNIPGDGTLKTGTVPLSAFGTSRTGFVRVGTQ